MFLLKTVSRRLRLLLPQAFACIASVCALANCDSETRKRVSDWRAMRERYNFADLVREGTISQNLPRLANRTGRAKELRLWYGFGLFGTGMIRLWQDSTVWHACRFPAEGEVSRGAVPALASDSVAALWQAAVDSGLLRLPRFPDRGDNIGMVMDGHSWVLESYDGRKYRVAEADNPDSFKSKDDRRVVAVAEAIVGEGYYDRFTACEGALATPQG